MDRNKDEGNYNAAGLAVSSTALYSQSLCWRCVPEVLSQEGADSLLLDFFCCVCVSVSQATSYDKNDAETAILETRRTVKTIHRYCSVM